MSDAAFFLETVPHVNANPARCDPQSLIQALRSNTEQELQKQAHSCASNPTSAVAAPQHGNDKDTISAVYPSEGVESVLPGTAAPPMSSISELASSVYPSTAAPPLMSSMSELASSVYPNQMSDYTAADAISAAEPTTTSVAPSKSDTTNDLKSNQALQSMLDQIIQQTDPFRHAPVAPVASSASEVAFNPPPVRAVEPAPVIKQPSPVTTPATAPTLNRLSESAQHAKQTTPSVASGGQSFSDIITSLRNNVNPGVVPLKTHHQHAPSSPQDKTQVSPPMTTFQRAQQQLLSDAKQMASSTINIDDIIRRSPNNHFVNLLRQQRERAATSVHHVYGASPGTQPNTSMPDVSTPQHENYRREMDLRRRWLDKLLLLRKRCDIPSIKEEWTMNDHSSAIQYEVHRIMRWMRMRERHEWIVDCIRYFALGVTVVNFIIIHSPILDNYLTTVETKLNNAMTRHYLDEIAQSAAASVQNPYWALAKIFLLPVVAAIVTKLLQFILNFFGIRINVGDIVARIETMWNAVSPSGSSGGGQSTFTRFTQGLAGLFTNNAKTGNNSSNGTAADGGGSDLGEAQQADEQGTTSPPPHAPPPPPQANNTINRSAQVRRPTRIFARK